MGKYFNEKLMNRAKFPTGVTEIKKSLDSEREEFNKEQTIKTKTVPDKPVIFTPLVKPVPVPLERKQAILAKSRREVQKKRRAIFAKSRESKKGKQA